MDLIPRISSLIPLTKEGKGLLTVVDIVQDFSEEEHACAVIVAHLLVMTRVAAVAFAMGKCSRLRLLSWVLARGVNVYAVKPHLLHAISPQRAYTNERPKGPSWRGEENAVSVINQRPIRVHQSNV